jgi:lipopolysaccharide/colanic/teichoic acid biosynthesis glycosyltransferase
MSLVGNRPLPLYEASSLTTNAFVPRFMAPAGITGLWQVTKRGYEKMSANERINLDILYAKKRSFFLDLKIMLLTPLALFQESDS